MKSDLIIDTEAYSSFSEYKNLLNPGGISYSRKFDGSDIQAHVKILCRHKEFGDHG
jgi:hypothetical protein